MKSGLRWSTVILPTCCLVFLASCGGVGTGKIEGPAITVINNSLCPSSREYRTPSGDLVLAVGSLATQKGVKVVISETLVSTPGFGPAPSGLADLSGAALGSSVLLWDEGAAAPEIIATRICGVTKVITVDGVLEMPSFVWGGYVAIKRIDGSIEVQDVSSLVPVGPGRSCGSGQVINIAGSQAFLIDGEWCAFDEKGQLLFVGKGSATPHPSGDLTGMAAPFIVEANIKPDLGTMVLVMKGWRSLDSQ